MNASVNHSGEKKKELYLTYKHEPQFEETCKDYWKGVQRNVYS